MSSTPPVPSPPLVHNPYPTFLPLLPSPHLLLLADSESLLAYDINFSHAAARLPPPAAPQPPIYLAIPKNGIAHICPALLQPRFSLTSRPQLLARGKRVHYAAL